MITMTTQFDKARLVPSKSRN